MNILIVLGNINEATFANSIIAANQKSKKIFKGALHKIYIIHTAESEKRLSQTDGWKDHLRINQIDSESFIQRRVEVSASAGAVEKYIDHLETILRGEGENANIIVDLTNGPTFQKSFLAIASYLLEINHQYLIDTVLLSKLTPERGFLPIKVLEKCYIAAPTTTQMDNIAYLNLSEVIRYKRIIEGRTAKFASLQSDSGDSTFFGNNLHHSIEIKLQADKKRDNALYRIAAASISASIEELVTSLLSQLAKGEENLISHQTLGEKFRRLDTFIEKNPPANFDIDFYRRFNDFMLYLRNTTTHKSKSLSDVEGFKSELSIKMAFPFIDFYTNIVFPTFSSDNGNGSSKKFPKMALWELDINEAVFCGLDGDDTGFAIENLFLSARSEQEFQTLSNKVRKGMNGVRKYIESFKEAKIIFHAGDDLFFKGKFARNHLVEMQRIYQTSSGLTCSIGYGKSFAEVYLALKYAKTHPGKNFISGITIG